MPASPESNELDGLRRLDSQVISAVYDRYFPDVFRFVRYRINDDKAAEDLSSDVFMRLLEAARANRAPDTNLRAWLLSTASHLVNDHLRRHYRRPVENLDESHADQRTNLPVEYEQKERLGRMKNALSTLTDEQQNVLALRFGGGFSLEETAAALKKNVNAIKQLQFRALAALQRKMDDLP